MLQRGDHVPHFEVATVDGETVRYTSIWQRRNLVLAVLPDPKAEAAQQYVAALKARLAEFGDQNTECVVTGDRALDLNAPGVLVADKWGEIAAIVSDADVAALPGVDALLEWVAWLQARCPECEGEAR